MKRILLLVTVALVMAAMMVASSMPALGVPGDPPNCEQGQSNAPQNAKHKENLKDCKRGLPPGEGHDK